MLLDISNIIGPSLLWYSTGSVYSMLVGYIYHVDDTINSLELIYHAAGYRNRLYGVDVATDTVIWRKVIYKQRLVM